MLTGLRLGNFKAFGETQNIPIKPLTLIFGANSAGKSSIIHGLLLARHANETGNLDVHQTKIGGEAVDLGGFRQYVHRRDAGRMVTWAATLNMAPIEDEIAATLFDYAERSNLSALYSEIRSILYETFILNLKSLGRLDFELSINLFELEEGRADSAFPWVDSYSVSTNGAPLLEMRRFIDGEMTPSYVDYTHPFFVGLWDLIAGAKEEAAQDDAFSSRQSYNSFFKKENPEYKRQMEAILQENVNDFPTVPQYLGVDKEDWDNKIEDYYWGRDYRGNFIPQLQSRSKSAANSRVASLLAKIKTEGEDTQAKKQARYYLTLELKQLEFEAFVGDLVNCLALLIMPQFDRIKYLGPVRFSPPRNLSSLDSQHPSWYAGGSEWNYVRRDTDVRASVNDWLAKLNTPYKLEVRRFVSTDSAADVIEELVLHDQRFGTYVSHKDVGFGISQVLPVLVSAYGSKNAIVAIEQPEIHLHPALQAELGDVFIESALGERKNTFLLETHSEHLILRIMRRMRDTVRGTLPEGMSPVRPEDVAILYVDRKQDDSTSVVMQLRLDEEGQLIDPWPHGFFEESFNERFA